MSLSAYRGIVRNGSVVLTDTSLALAEGSHVLVTPLPAPGDIHGLLEALKGPPYVPSEDLDELMRAIDQGIHYQPSDRFLTDPPEAEAS